MQCEMVTATLSAARLSRPLKMPGWQVVRLRAKLTGAGSAIKGAFGMKPEKDPAVVKLEALQVLQSLSAVRIPFPAAFLPR